MSQSGETKAAAKVKKSTHRPSKTPTGLPGDEPKPHRHKRHREKLGEVVDTLLVPEHKAARRIIRRSQRRNPQTGITNNMTLYERIMAYRKLKGKEGDNDEINEQFTEDELRKLERSDTGWGSVDISQITNRKDEDDERRSPTPQPTLTDDVSSRRRNQEDYEAQATARDVVVDVDDGLNKKEPIPPIRSTTPQKKRTPTPNAERANSRQSDINKHTVLPPIQDQSRQDRVEEKYEEKVKEINNEKYVDDRRKSEAAVVATSAVAARSERREESNVREESERREEDVRREEIKETRNESVKESEKYENERHEEKKVVNERRDGKREERSEEKYDERRESVKKEEREDYKKEHNDERESKREEKEETRREENKNESYEKETEKTDRRETGDVVEATTVAAVMSSQRRSATPKERTPSPRQKSRQRRTETPQREPTPRQPDQRSEEPVVRKEAAAAARGPPPEARRSPKRREPSRSLPKRKTSMDDEIDRLDKIVDRDLNDIISSLGKKGGNRNNGSQKDDSLKQKILDPNFQADMDRYLRDI